VGLGVMYYQGEGTIKNWECREIP